MSKFKGHKGPWTVEEGWADGHVSISSPEHGALAQVVCNMECPTDNKAERERDAAKLKANLTAIQMAPEMAEFITALFEGDRILLQHVALEKRLTELYSKLIQVA